MKLPVALLTAFGGMAMVVVGVITGGWPLAVMGGLGGVCGIVVLVEMARGRNPSWMRSRYDPPQ